MELRKGDFEGSTIRSLSLIGFISGEGISLLCGLCVVPFDAKSFVSPRVIADKAA